LSLRPKSWNVLIFNLLYAIYYAVLHKEVNRHT